jgi:hypothetical protein
VLFSFIYLSLGQWDKGGRFALQPACFLGSRLSNPGRDNAGTRWTKRAPLPLAPVPGAISATPLILNTVSQKNTGVRCHARQAHPLKRFLSPQGNGLRDRGGGFMAQLWHSLNLPQGSLARTATIQFYKEHSNANR